MFCDENEEEDLTLSDSDDDDCCCVCLDAACDAMLIPCGHSELCNVCANMLLGNNYPERRRCPLCRTPIGSITAIVSRTPSGSPTHGGGVAPPSGGGPPMRLGARSPPALQIAHHVHGESINAAATARLEAEIRDAAAAASREAAGLASAMALVLEDPEPELRQEVEIALSPEQRARRLARIEAIYGGGGEDDGVDMMEERRIELGQSLMHDEAERRHRAQREAAEEHDRAAYQAEVASELVRVAEELEGRNRARIERRERAKRRRLQRHRRKKERCRIGKCGGPAACRLCRKSKCPRDCFGRHGAEYKPTLMTYLRYYLGIGRIGAAAGGNGAGGTRSAKGRWGCCKGFNRLTTHCDGVYRGRRILPLAAVLMHESSVGPTGEFFAENADPALLSDGLAEDRGGGSPRGGGGGAGGPTRGGVGGGEGDGGEGDAFAIGGSPSMSAVLVSSPSPAMRAAAAAASPRAAARLAAGGGGFSDRSRGRRSSASAQQLAASAIASTTPTGRGTLTRSGFAGGRGSARVAPAPVVQV